MKTKFIIGTSGWNYPAWKSSFYPKDIPQKRWLEYYENHFDIVELNATFYRLFEKKVFVTWRKRARKNFKYIVKVNRYITHIKHLKNCRAAIKKFLRRVAVLEDKLAMMLLQLPPNMPYDIKRLRSALLAFDDPSKVIVEFRDKKWFTDEVQDLLTELNVTFCIADSPTIDLINCVTSKTAYIRMHGRTIWFNYNYSKAELQEVARFARKLAKQGTNKIYIMFNNDYYAYAVRNAQYLQSLLNKSSVNKPNLT